MIAKKEFQVNHYPSRLLNFISLKINLQLISYASLYKTNKNKLPTDRIPEKINAKLLLTYIDLFFLIWF